MIKGQFSFTENHADIAYRLAAMANAMFPANFEMKTPKPKDGFFHVYLNPRGEFRK